MLPPCAHTNTGNEYSMARISACAQGLLFASLSVAVPVAESGCTPDKLNRSSVRLIMRNQPDAVLLMRAEDVGILTGSLKRPNTSKEPFHSSARAHPPFK